ncbi:glycosyltransferase involved in cell wall biosynthesis [Ereboglobus sp. PH5-5]|uniref:glycosyltransferase family 2 protein n=1 Tax=Ereboglobus sp. PH5-5 TaxID=2940529 RepID=UPI0024059C99|nr:glycosyltransferase family 2 protein [Ereboglobus sp. PH5-5]MDF9833635.1 glycosyltransferase involved in cell wall biosynthesis [Ereboglobus sp. PH5-5]
MSAPVSKTHLVLIPSYNTGAQLLLETVRNVLAHWAPVWVVIDGSTDGSGEALQSFAAGQPDGTLRVIVREKNSGKGASVFHAAKIALAEGFTHALVMDADGQHPVGRIRDFMAASQAEPAALVLGKPVFGPEAPLVRLKGRKLSIGLVHFECLGGGIDDPLFGFRVYPLAPLVDVMRRTWFARRYDFDPELAVRLFWAGVPPVNLPAACKYLSRTEGGVSHFHYLRDNLRMIWLHTRLITELLLHKWPAARRAQKKRKQQSSA